MSFEKEIAEAMNGCGEMIYNAWNDGDRTYDEVCNGTEYMCSRCQAKLKELNSLQETQAKGEIPISLVSEPKFGEYAKKSDLKHNPVDTQSQQKQGNLLTEGVYQSSCHDRTMRATPCETTLDNADGLIKLNHHCPICLKDIFLGQDTVHQKGKVTHLECYLFNKIVIQNDITKQDIQTNCPLGETVSDFPQSVYYNDHKDQSKCIIQNTSKLDIINSKLDVKSKQDIQTNCPLGETKSDFSEQEVTQIKCNHPCPICKGDILSSQETIYENHILYHFKCYMNKALTDFAEKIKKMLTWSMPPCSVYIEILNKNIDKLLSEMTK